MKNVPAANPWLTLSKQPPFVLPQDEPMLDVYNARHNPSLTAYRLHLPPLPFQGNPEAPILVLGLNPGYDIGDETKQTTDYFLETSFRNYHHDATLPYPLFFLDPQIEGSASGKGQQWWYRRLKHLRGLYDDTLLAQALLSIQYVPYRSTTYKSARQTLPSQDYSFALVNQAIERNALIIGLRSRKLWVEAVEGLKDYQRFYTTSSPRNPILSAQQLGKGYEELLAELNKLRQATSL